MGLELLYRRRSHITMFTAGGVCFLALGKIRKASLPYPVKTAAGAATVTAVELTTGLLFNRDYHIWDYREIPGNFRGQICPLFTALWLPVSAAGMELYALAESALDR